MRVPDPAQTSAIVFMRSWPWGSPRFRQPSACSQAWLPSGSARCFGPRGSSGSGGLLAGLGLGGIWFADAIDASSAGLGDAGLLVAA